MPYVNHMDLISDANMQAFLFSAARDTSPPGYIDRVAGPVLQQTQLTVPYSGIGAAPVVRKINGKRTTQDQRFDDYSITSELWGIGLRLRRIDMTIDKTAQVKAQINTLGPRWHGDWLNRVIAKLKAGETDLCYDQKPFFAANHQTGKSGVQSNILEYDVAVPTVPTPEEAEMALWEAVEQMTNLVDDQNEPIHANPTSFVVFAPSSFARSLLAATKMTVMPNAAGGMNALVTASGVSFDIVTPPQIGITNTEVHGAAWTSQFSVHVADSRSFIRQTLAGWETWPEKKAEGSDYDFDTFGHEYGISGYRGIGYGDWKSAVLVKLVTS